MSAVYVVIRSGEDAANDDIVVEGAFTDEAAAYARAKDLKDEGEVGVEVYPTALV